jgi:transcriptional regulatory protein GAL4
MSLRALFTGDLGVDSPDQLPTGSTTGDINAIPVQFPGPTVPLSGSSEHVFIDAYFLYYHTTYPFLHEATFRAQYAGQSPRPRDTTWRILLNTVLALGAWSIGDENSTMDDTFYHEVNRLSRDTSVFEVGNLTLVQALLLLSNYTQKRNKPNTGWNYLGLAVRMALSLGLYKEIPEWKISLLQREMRRRVWWGIFIFDSGASITFGCPVLLPENGIMDVNPVLNIHEEVSGSLNLLQDHFDIV